jgi:deazaflavin-dependent oxidoreductase (nitroreductase family)
MPGTNLSRILTEPEFRRSFHAKLKTYNPFIVALYQVGLLPLFGVSRTVMLLTTRGRKSGKLRHTPIGYFRIGGVIYLFSAWGKASSWYKNLSAAPEDVSIQIGWRKLPVNAQILVDPAEIQCTIEQLVTESPSTAQYLFGWQPGQDRIDAADFSPVIQNVTIVRFVEV